MRRRLQLLVLAMAMIGARSVHAVQPGPSNREGRRELLALATPTIDGVHDAVWGAPVAVDPLGDMSEPNLDLNNLYLLEDATNFYIGFDAFASNWGMTYGIYIDTDQVDGSGATTDPWGRAVDAVAGHRPEYAIYAYHNGADTLGDAQLNAWDGGSWTYPTLTSLGGAQGYGAANNWIEYAVPKAALGNPTRIAVSVFTTGGSGHAQDTVPSDPNVAYTAPDWGASTTTLTEFVLFPPLAPPELSLVVTAPAENEVCTSAGIDVSGSVVPTTGVTVTVDLNGANQYTPTVGPDGTFSQAVTLALGSNTITVTAGDGQTTCQVVCHVTYDYASEAVPTLADWGVIVYAVLVLLVGAAALTKSAVATG
jgi:hypothetical protein